MFLSNQLFLDFWEVFFLQRSYPLLFSLYALLFLLSSLYGPQMFVEEVMELVELNPLRDALVGLPGLDGLSTEQRKRLTIAVELVANPSIIFMDEPTSGLDARAAAIVMRTVRNTVDTGRTVVCTIHQPSIDIFEAFDEVNFKFLNVAFRFWFWIFPLFFVCVSNLNATWYFSCSSCCWWKEEVKSFMPDLLVTVLTSS